MLVTFNVPAPDGEAFTPDAFAPRVGKPATFSSEHFPELGETAGILAGAFVTPGGDQAELTAELPDDSPMAREIAAQAGGYTGPVKVRRDGHISRLVQIRRREEMQTEG